MSNPINDGGPAFPLSHPSAQPQDGMSLRAFAAIKMVPTAFEMLQRAYEAKQIKSYDPDSIAVAACVLADALIAELEKGGAK